MNNIKKYIPMLTLIVSFALLGGIVGNSIFAQDDMPVLIISGKTNIDSIFRQSMEPIYPGHYISNTLRIQNDSKADVALKKIGMKIILKNEGGTIDMNSTDGKDYMKYADIKIDYKNPLKSMVNGNIFKGNFQEFVSGINTNIKIGSNSSLDLIFTVGMNKEAEINVAGIEGLIDFTFKIEQLTEDKDNNNDDNQNEDHSYVDKAEEYVFVPDGKIPLSKVDDTKDHWAHDCIATLIGKGIIKGYEDGTIRPENNITRGEAAVLVGRALGVKENTTIESKYIDELPLWSKGYILPLTEKGILEGYTNGAFKPNQYITREEMTKILVIAFNKKAINNEDIAFIDSDEIGSWAVEYVKAGVDNQVIEGYPDNTFKPKENITRAETFTIICKLLGLHETHQQQ